MIGSRELSSEMSRSYARKAIPIVFSGGLREKHPVNIPIRYESKVEEVAGMHGSCNGLFYRLGYLEGREAGYCEALSDLVGRKIDVKI